METAWQKKYDEALAGKDDEIKRLTSNIEALTVGAVASQMASKLALEGSENLLKGPIQSRLAVEWEENRPLVKVLGKDGKISASTTDELEREIAADSQFARILAGTRSRGGGVRPNDAGGPQKPAGQEMTRDDFMSLSHSERAELSKKGIRLV